MLFLTDAARQVSAKLRHGLRNDPLLRPLGRTCDGTINRALAVRKLRRADLFTLGKTVAPHRRRLAEMLRVYHFPTRYLAARHWRELKLADHRCAHCGEKKRCDRWLRNRGGGDTPRRFCPNVATFERWRCEYLRRGADTSEAEADPILEDGLTQTRDLLKRRQQ